MPIYLNGTKYVGGYMNGHRVNGYINGQKMFNYVPPHKLPFSESIHIGYGTHVSFYAHVGERIAFGGKTTNGYAVVDSPTMKKISTGFMDYDSTGESYANYTLNSGDVRNGVATFLVRPEENDPTVTFNIEVKDTNDPRKFINC